MDFGFYGENMDSSILISKDDIVIYESDIEYIVDEYKNKLDDPNLIYKTSCFHGLLLYIYNRYLKNIVRKDNNYNYDYETLDSIYYNIYLPLCSKYNITPTVIQFSCLCHIDIALLSDIQDGKLRNIKNVNSRTTEIVRGWYKNSEGTILGKAIDSNSVGSIFALKSIYKYNDSQPIQIEYNNTESHQTVDEIRQKYASAFLPSKDELSDNLESIDFSDND